MTPPKPNPTPIPAKSHSSRSVSDNYMSIYIFFGVVLNSFLYQDSSFFILYHTWTGVGVTDPAFILPPLTLGAAMEWPVTCPVSQLCAVITRVTARGPVRPHLPDTVNCAASHNSYHISILSLRTI